MGKKKGYRTKISTHAGRKTKIVYSGRKVVGKIPMKALGQGFTKGTKKRKK